MKKLNITTLDELIESKYGKIGTPNRDKFEKKSKQFIEREMKKNKKKSTKEEFSKYDLMFPDLTQLKLEKAQLKAYMKTTQHLKLITRSIVLIIAKLNRIESKLGIK